MFRLSSEGSKFVERVDVREARGSKAEATRFAALRMNELWLPVLLLCVVMLLAIEVRFAALLDVARCARGKVTIVWRHDELFLASRRSLSSLEFDLL